MVPAWRSYAFRVPKDEFEKLLISDNSLKRIFDTIEKKIFLLNFQHRLIGITKDTLSLSFQNVINKNKIVQFKPKDLNSFFKICFILDNFNKTPKMPNIWLIYLLSYINEDLTLENIFKIIYSLDFLYSKVMLKPNEIATLIKNLKFLLKKIKSFYKSEGFYQSSIKISPYEETRYVIFSINLLEDLIQDMIYYYSISDFKPIKKIYENIINLDKIYNWLNK